MGGKSCNIALNSNSDFFTGPLITNGFGGLNITTMFPTMEKIVFNSNSTDGDYISVYGLSDNYWFLNGLASSTSGGFTTLFKSI